MKRIEFTFPCITKSEANLRDHWAVKARRAKAQRGATWAHTRAEVWKLHPHPIDGGTWTITLTRFAPRKLDSDNLARSMKAVRDGVADALGMNDGDSRLTWNYMQGPRLGSHRYAVRVEIEEGRHGDRTGRPAP